MIKPASAGPFEARKNKLFSGDEDIADIVGINTTSHDDFTNAIYLAHAANHLPKLLEAAERMEMAIDAYASDDGTDDLREESLGKACDDARAALQDAIAAAKG